MYTTYPILSLYVLYIVICPTPLGFGVCVEACSSDDDCALDERCCSNGCGHQCTKGTLCAVSRHKTRHYAPYVDVCIKCFEYTQDVHM